MIKNIIRDIFIDYDFKNDINFLKTIDFFKQFNEKQLRKIIPIIYKKNYVKGEVLYNCGEELKIFFILKTGQIELISSVGIIKKATSRLISQEDTVSQIYTTTAKVAEDSFVYIIDKQEFYDLMNANIWVEIEIINKLFKKVKNVFKK